MKKQNPINPLYLTIAAIVLGCIADVFCVLEIEVGDSLVFGFGHLIFTIIALGCGITAISKLWKSKQILKISGIAQMFVLVITGFALFYFYDSYTETFRSRKAVSHNGRLRIMQFGNFINESAKAKGRMPDADYWCDSLFGRPLGSGRLFGVGDSDFKIVTCSDVECNFAFNKNLSNLSIDNLSGNVVVLFEADGKLNLSGGPELINTKRAKDKYFWPWNQKFIYIFFFDGMVVKYRLNDGAVALYDPDKEHEYDAFTDYQIKGETPYSPLKWK